MQFIEIEAKKKTCEELIQDKDLNNKLDQLSDDDLDTLWENAANQTSEWPDCPYVMAACSFLTKKLDQRQKD